MYIWPICIPGQSFMGSVARFDSSRVMCPERSGPTEPAVEWGGQPKALEAGLTFEAGGDVIRQGDGLERRGEHELARMQDESATPRQVPRAWSWRAVRPQCRCAACGGSGTRGT